MAKIRKPTSRRRRIGKKPKTSIFKTQCTKCRKRMFKTKMSSHINRCTYHKRKVCKPTELDTSSDSDVEGITMAMSIQKTWNRTKKEREKDE